MEAVEREVGGPLSPQPGPREKASQLERLRALLADLEDHQAALSSLEEKARELFKKTGDASFNHGARTQPQAQFDDLAALVEVRKMFIYCLVLIEKKYFTYFCGLKPFCSIMFPKNDLNSLRWLCRRECILRRP